LIDSITAEMIVAMRANVIRAAVQMMSVQMMSIVESVWETARVKESALKHLMSAL